MSAVRNDKCVKMQQIRNCNCSTTSEFRCLGMSIRLQVKCQASWTSWASGAHFATQQPLFFTAKLFLVSLVVLPLFNECHLRFVFVCTELHSYWQYLMSVVVATGDTSHCNANTIVSHCNLINVAVSA